MLLQGLMVVMSNHPLYSPVRKYCDGSVLNSSFFLQADSLGNNRAGIIQVGLNKGDVKLYYGGCIAVRIEASIEDPQYMLSFNTNSDNVMEPGQVTRKCDTQVHEYHHQFEKMVEKLILSFSSEPLDTFTPQYWMHIGISYHHSPHGHKSAKNYNTQHCVTCRDGPPKNSGSNQCISSYTAKTQPGLRVQQL